MGAIFRAGCSSNIATAPVMARLERWFAVYCACRACSCNLSPALFTCFECLTNGRERRTSPQTRAASLSLASGKHPHLMASGETSSAHGRHPDRRSAANACTFQTIFPTEAISFFLLQFLMCVAHSIVHHQRWRTT